MPLALFDGKQRVDSGPKNLTAFLVARFLLKGPHADKWKEFVEALRETDVNLVKSAEEAFGLKGDEFEKEWAEATRAWAAEK